MILVNNCNAFPVIAVTFVLLPILYLIFFARLPVYVDSP
jgi:hypothetical protein